MLQQKLYSLIWYSLCTICSAHSARILGIFTFEGRSHFNFHEAIVKHLLHAGHHVTVVAPFKSEHSHPNYTLINSKNEKPGQKRLFASMANNNITNFLLNIQLMDILERDCQHVMSLTDVKALRNYDVMLVELMPMGECYLPIAQNLRIPVIATTSTRSLIFADYIFGNPRMLSTFPCETLFAPRGRMSFFERLTNVVGELELKILNTIVRRRVRNFYDELRLDQHPQSSMISLLLVNDHPTIMTRTMVPNIVSIGGIDVKSATLNSLPDDLRMFVEGAEHGVIFFSMGSLATSNAMNSRLKSVLRNAFAKIPQRVIWKYDSEIEGLSANVLLRAWLPQKEILAHDNVLAFITHCGLGSMYEGVYFGKPLITMPMFADQPGNAAAISSLGVGLNLDIEQLDEKKLLNAIDAIINDTRYRDNMKELTKRFKDDPQSPAQLAVYWIEYVIRHNGSSHLRWIGADVPLYQYLLLDVFAFMLATFVLVVFASIRCAKYAFDRFSFEGASCNRHISGAEKKTL